MIKKVSLFTSKRDFLLFLGAILVIFTHSIYIEYKNYQKLILFDSYIIDATVIKQYLKTKNNRTYHVLKLKSEDGLTFYTTAKKSLQDVMGKKLQLEIYAGNINFYDYLKSFYARSKIVHVDDKISIKQNFNTLISSLHVNQNIANIYQALYSAAPLKYELQKIFSNLGISHLIAISGFHLGVLSALLYFLIRPFYRFFQARYFPYRNSKLDIFLIVSVILFSYMSFLDFPPSLIRAFGMLLIGFILYDRGVEIISMQTLFIAVVLLLALLPRLFFHIGFWLSVGGVFFIFLFFIHFKDLGKIKQFVFLPVIVYILMLPISLMLFKNFSLYHPLSILWSIVFTIFYPLSIALHVAGFGDIFDGALEYLLYLGEDGVLVELNISVFLLFMALSAGAIFFRPAFFMALSIAIGVQVFAIVELF